MTQPLTDPNALQTVRTLDSMTDAEAIHIANLAYGNFNLSGELISKMRNPCVHHFIEDAVKLVLIIQEHPEPFYHTDELKDFEWVEIDEGFCVRERHNTLSDMPEIYGYLVEQGFIYPASFASKI